jgi:hypothetical protein
VPILIIAALLVIFWLAAKFVSWLIPPWIKDPSRISSHIEQHPESVLPLAKFIVWLHPPKGMSRKEVRQIAKQLGVKELKQVKLSKQDRRDLAARIASGNATNQEWNDYWAT